MAEITLRAYLQEIDDLVEHEQLDEAIAHCRHVLQIYPKHLETYRLLGKSYLEAKRYGDAADLFQRVLSAIPDDFVAHIGMSIVREDEGNLDAAIWHMERAFETNPANPAIQQELRRLIGRRDGLEPHKVRLTRGALARMYAHGELYPQAIAELRSALQEDTDRPDLQTLLAEMYWRTEQRAEAAEVCTRLLEKLPYCRDALRIIAAALHAGGQVDDAAVYHRRLASLDPYTAFLDTAVGDSKSVEAGAVKVEKLVWHPGQPLPAGEAGRPQWTTTPAAATTSAAGQAIPSWLSALDGSPAPVQAPAPVEPEPATETTVHPFAGAKPPEKAEVPTWMQQAGWGQSSGPAVDAPVSFSEEEMERLDGGQAPLPPVGEAELQPADIPDWLQKIAPSPGPRYPQEPSTRPSTSGPSDLPDWLGEFAGDQAPSPQESPGVPVASSGAIAPATASSPTPASNELPAGLFDRDDSGGPPPSPAPSEQVPTWLETPADGATETIVTWLGRKDTGPEVPSPTADVPAGPAASPNAPEDEVPSWVGRMKSSGSSQPAAASGGEGEGLPSWLSGVAEAASQEDSFTPTDLEAIRPSAPALPGAEFEDEPASGMPKGEAPDWLKAIATTDAEPQVPADVVTPPEPKTEEPPAPDWMTGVPGREPASRGFVKEEATPAWLRGTDVPAGLGALVPPSEEAEPEWLRGTGEPEAGPPAPPDWMRGIAEAAAAASPVDRDSPVDSTTSEAEIEANEPVMASDVPAAETMISMRRETPAEGTPVPPAESAAGEPPEWLREFASLDEPTGPSEELAAADVPAWLRSLGQTGAASDEAELPAGVEEPSTAEFQGALDWLQETASEVAPDPTQRPVYPSPAPSAVGPPDLGITEPVSDDEVFRWLEDLASRQAEEEPSLPGRQEPDAGPVEAPAPLSVTASAMGPSLDWLDSPGEPQDVSTDSSPLIVDSEEPDLAESAADDEWLRDMAASPSPPLPTDLWDKLDTEETAVSSAAGFTGPEASSAEIPRVPAPVRPAMDETVPGSPRPGLAGPRRPPEQPVRPQTTPLTEGEVVEWLRQTASGGKPASGAEGSTGLPETAAIPMQGDQAAGLAVQLVQAGRAALSSGDVPAALQAYAPVIERGLLLNSVIEDLRKAVELRPEATAIWQALGDAYKKANRLPEAIKAFSRAMKEGDGLEVARQALAQGDFALAVVQYGGLIKKKRNLESVIGDLRGALDDEPRRPPLWQALGDAYMKANRLPEAIDAYRRGMESV